MARKTSPAVSEGLIDRTVRERLLIAGASVFAQKGYAGAFVEEIVAKASVTKPVLYYWFGSKEGLFLELMGDAFARVTAALEGVAREPGTAAERLYRLGDRVLELLAQNVETARIMYSLYYGPPQGAPPFDFEAFHTTLREAVRQMIVEGIRQGEFRTGDADDFTWAFLGAVSICIEAHLGHPELAPHTRAIFARTFQVLVQGIGARTHQETRA